MDPHLTSHIEQLDRFGSRWSRRLAPILAQWRALRSWLIPVYGTTIALLAAVGAVAYASDVRLGDLTSDPLVAASQHVAHAGGATAELPGYLGALSNVGIVLWCIAFAASGLAALVVHGRRTERLGGGRDAPFLAHATAISGLLLVDDLFMIHDHWGAQLGIPEWLLLAAIGGTVGHFLWRWRARILKTEYLPLSLAFVGLGASVVLAQFTCWFWLIDSAKFIGIVSWGVYHVRVATKVLAAPAPSVSRTEHWSNRPIQP